MKLRPQPGFDGIIDAEPIAPGLGCEEPIDGPKAHRVELRHIGEGHGALVCRDG